MQDVSLSSTFFAQNDQCMQKQNYYYDYYYYVWIKVRVSNLMKLYKMKHSILVGVTGLTLHEWISLKDPCIKD